MARYTPRRASKRWLDSDCPADVLCILDHPRFTDRYTVFYRTPHNYAGRVYISGRAMSENPFHPQGVGLSIEYQAHEVAAYRYRNKHRYARWSTLPEAVKRCVRMDLTEEAA